MAYQSSVSVIHETSVYTYVNIEGYLLRVSLGLDTPYPIA